MSFHDKTAQTVVIPVRIQAGKAELLYGGPLPTLADGTIGELRVPAFAFRDHEALQQFIAELSGPILDAQAVLLVCVPQATGSHPGVLREPPHGTAFGIRGPFVEIVLIDPLELTLRGTKRASLRDCRCRIPSMDKEANSVNHAYTIISQHVEATRRAYGGNVFEKVLFSRHDKSGRLEWLRLDQLRRPREAAIEERVRRLAAAKPEGS